MCVKKIYFNTYADGAQDVTEQVHACREGKMCLNPEVRTYERKLSFNKGDLDPEPPRKLRPNSYYLGGDLPTPRRSKSPSPSYRREPEAGPSGSPKPNKHHGYRDRHDYRDPHRRSSRHVDLDREPASPSKLKRTNTAPHLVVIEQGAPVFSTRDLPPGVGPIHVAEDHGLHRRSSRRHRERDADERHSSSNPNAFVIVNDEREHRRRTREHKRRMSSSSTSRPDPALITPPAEEHSSEPREPRRRYSLRRSNTVVLPTTEAPSPPSKHLRWEDEVRVARERQNDEISKRKKPLEVHQDSGLKGILKPAPSPPTRGKPFTRQDSDLGGLRRAVESLDLPTADMTPEAEELKLYDRDRLLARFGGSDEGDRSRRRRGGTKVWTGDRYQYL